MCSAGCLSPTATKLQMCARAAAWQRKPPLVVLWSLVAAYHLRFCLAGHAVVFNCLSPTAGCLPRDLQRPSGRRWHLQARCDRRRGTTCPRPSVSHRRSQSFRCAEKRLLGSVNHPGGALVARCCLLFAVLLGWPSGCPELFCHRQPVAFRAICSGDGGYI